MNADLFQPTERGFGCSLLGGNPKPRIMIVEDEALMGSALKRLFETEFGCDVVGPITTLKAALRTARDAPLSFAILDVTVTDGDVFPVADVLKSRGIPFIFHTGHGASEAHQAPYQGLGLYAQPSGAGGMATAMRRMLS